jgi:1,4-alpha-glucan branching enzyme
LQHRLGVPALCGYQEIFNSDSTYYGGSNTGNGMGLQASPHQSHGRPYSIELTLPPLATVILKPMK